jgi:hypothetical protein
LSGEVPLVDDDDAGAPGVGDQRPDLLVLFESRLRRQDETVMSLRAMDSSVRFTLKNSIELSTECRLRTPAVSTST